MQTPDSACPTYRALYHGLEEFERDLHHHVNRENDILFPRASLRLFRFPSRLQIPAAGTTAKAAKKYCILDSWADAYVFSDWFF